MTEHKARGEEPEVDADQALGLPANGQLAGRDPSIQEEFDAFDQYRQGIKDGTIKPEPLSREMEAFRRRMQFG
ncbi:MAG: hypothetical protein ACPGZP_10480 [Panacagrimonas sp.]